MITDHMKMGVETTFKMLFINYTSDNVQQNIDTINHCHKPLQNQ